MARDSALRDQLRKLLDWEDAHVGFDTAVAGIPASKHGVVPGGLPHSLWQLVEHMNRAQHDILDFCRNPHYRELTFPDDYWPATAEPPDPGAWDASVAAFRGDIRELQTLAADTSLDLFAPIPHGSGQTYLRELLLVADHNAYHVGEIVLTRQALGIWKR
jgi:hypothetical protein